MPNQFELNDNGFDNLLVENDINQESVTTAESVDNTSVEENTDNNNVNNSDDSNESNYSSEVQENDTSSDQDFIKTFLSEYGVENGKITYENEDGSTEDKDFDTLDSSEKINILKQLTNPNLTEDEVKTINYLRTNNATIEDVIDYYSQKAVNDYINQNGPVEKQYSIDEYTDDELYIADLKTKYSNMSEQELQADLDIAKENTDLFKKKVDTIRKQYKEQEEAEAQSKIRERENQFNEFKNSLETSLIEFNDISMDYKDSKSDSLQIEDSEKDKIYSYILDRDENGASQFFKDLNDPKMLVRLA